MQRSLTCSRLPALVWLLGISSYCATVTGTVQVTIPGSGHERRSNSNLSDIIVWLQPAENAIPPPVAGEHARLLQKDKMFHPHVLPIRIGTVVDFPNADPIFHNAFSNYDGQLFDVGLYPPGTTRSVRFRRPGVVRVFCNIHPTMSAVILALDTPYYTRIGSDGQYRIPDVAPGSYTLRVFDERATQAPESLITVEVNANESQAVAPAIQLGEAGYLQPPHKNKFGLDYPPNSNGSYNGSPQ